MSIKRLRFHIHGTTPETCPLDTLLEYLKSLSTILGSKEHVHLVNISDGSLQALIGVEEEEYTGTKTRITDAAKGKSTREANNSYHTLTKDLERDSRSAELLDDETEELVQEFARKIKREQTFGPFWQQGSLYGYLKRLEGSDDTDHATLVYDNGSCKCEMGEAIGHRLAPFYRSPVRVYGKGRWYRNADGKWELLRFVVDNFDPLDELTLVDAVRKLRAIPNNGLLKLDDPLGEMQKIRDGTN